MVAVTNIAFFIAAAAAAALSKRDVAQVIADIGTIGTNTDALTTALQGYSGISSSPPILAASSTLQKSVDQATSDVNAAGTATADQQAQIIAAVEKLIPGVYNSLTVFESKFSQFQSDGLQQVAVNNLNTLQTSTDNLSKALISKASGDAVGPANALASEIDAGFNAAKSNAPLPATTPIAIPGGGSSPTSAGGSAPATTAPTTAGASSGAPASTAAATPTSTLTVYTGAAIANGVNFGAAAAAFVALLF